MPDKLKVLIVDDRKDSRRLLRKVVESRGYVVQEAGDGVEALDKLKRWDADLIISDILMPNMGGFRLIKEVKTDKSLKDIPFVFYTATYVEKKDEELALSLGASRFIVKPATPDEFIKIVLGVIGDAKKGQKKPRVEDEKEVLKLYSERLVNKLEKKMLQLEREITERKKAEEALQEREHFLSLIFECIQDGISVLDKNMNIVRVNLSMERWYSHAMPLVGKKCYEAYHERSERCDICPSHQTLSSGKAAYEVVPKRELGGEIVGWMDLYSFPLVDTATGQLKGVIEYVHDITERKQAEEALTASEEKYSTLVEKGNDGIIIIQDGLLRFANTKMTELTGFSLEETIGKSFIDFVSPEYKRLVLERYKKRISGDDVPHRYEIEILSKEGNNIPVEVNASLIDYEGRPADMAIIRDITERREAEEAQKHHLEELTTVCEIDRSIIENPDLSSLLRFIVGRAKKFTGADTAFFGFIEDNELRHRTFLGIHTKAFKNMRLPKGTGLGWIALKEKKSIAVEDYFADKRMKDAPYDVVRKEGLISFLAVPFLSGKGEPLGVLYVANRKKTKFAEEPTRTLVTLAGQVSVAVEHARLAEETKKALEELEDLDRLKTDIIANVSHELRTPLTIVSSALELLKDEDNAEGRKRLFKLAFNALTRQNQTIEDLINAASIGKSGIELNLEPVDIDQVITLVFSKFRFFAGRKKVKLIKKLHADTPPLRADFGKLEHIVRNLVHNAIKFNEGGGEVVVETRVKDGAVEVKISDKGIGISEDTLDKIFQPLYQGDPSSTRTYEGTGMGLAVVKELVEAQGGTVSVKSAVGRGSNFCFTLPISREKQSGAL